LAHARWPFDLKVTLLLSSSPTGHGHDATYNGQVGSQRIGRFQSLEVPMKLKAALVAGALALIAAAPAVMAACPFCL
jgi:hypothetical protein